MTNPTAPLLTESEVSEIEARANAATEGPWQLGGNYWDRNSVTARKGQHFIADCGKHPLSAEFIAHARTDIPALIRDLRALNADLQAHRELAEAFKTVLDKRESENAALREQLAGENQQRGLVVISALINFIDWLATQGVLVTNVPESRAVPTRHEVQAIIAKHVTAPSPSSPVPPEQKPLCVLCGHNDLDADGVTCAAPVPICSDDHHGIRHCDCKCRFPAATPAPVEQEQPQCARQPWACRYRNARQCAHDTMLGDECPKVCDCACHGERPRKVFDAGFATPSPSLARDAWSKWFDRLGDKASADVVNATADLVTDERLAALVQAGVLPKADSVGEEGK